MPPLLKTCPKMVLSHKGGSLCVKDVFCKKIFGVGRDSAGGALASVLRKHTSEGRTWSRGRDPAVPDTMLGRIRGSGEEPMLDIRRRQFITLLSGAAAAWPLAARAQQAAMRPTIGFLGSGTPAVQGQWVAAFVQRLRELGWIEGRSLTIEYRWAEGSADRAAELAAEFVRRKVDVIVTYANPMVVATKQATSVIPIVFAAAADPVGTGLVAGLARPGGNVTGLSAQNTDLAGKHLELLRDLIPGLRRLAIMANVDNSASVLEMREVQAAARTIGL